MKINVTINTESDALWGNSTETELAAFDIAASEANFLARVQTAIANTFKGDEVNVEGQEHKNDITIETGEGWEADRKAEEQAADIIADIIAEVHSSWAWTIDR